MTKASRFSLTNNRNPIKLIGVNAPFQPKIQFGYEYTSDNDKRTELLHQSAVSNMHQRTLQESSIREPAPQRTQTILNCQLAPQLQQQLHSGFSIHPNQGRTNNFPQLDHINIGQMIPIEYTTKRQNISAIPVGNRMTLRAVNSVY